MTLSETQSTTSLIYHLSTQFGFTDLNSSDSSTSAYNYLQPVTTFFRRWPPYIIIPLAFIGNSLSIIILSRRSLRKMQVSVFLRFLAVFDTITVLVGYFIPWLRDEAKYLQNHVSESTCKVERFFMFYCADVSVWILAALTVERMILIVYPFYGRQLSTNKNAIIIFALLCGLAVLKNWPLFFVMGLTTEKVCEKLDNVTFFSFYESNVRPWISLLMYYSIPAVLIVVSNFHIVRSLRNVNRFRMITQPRSVQNLNTSLELTVVHRSTASDLDMNSFNSTKDRFQLQLKAERQSVSLVPRAERELRAIHQMILAVTILFMILVTPSIIMWTIATLNSKAMDKFISNLLFAVGDCLVFTHHSTNFILYAISGRRFRFEMIAMFRCR